MAEIKINEAFINDFSFKDGSYNCKVQFPRSTNSALRRIHLEDLCNQPLVLTVGKKQEDLFDDEETKNVSPNPKDVKAEHIPVPTKEMNKLKILESAIDLKKLRKGKITKAFTYQDRLFVSYGGALHVEGSQAKQFECHELIHQGDWSLDEAVYTLEEKEKLPQEQRRPLYRGISVEFKKKQYIIGDPFIFVEQLEADKAKDSKKSTTKKTTKKE